MPWHEFYKLLVAEFGPPPCLTPSGQCRTRIGIMWTAATVATMTELRSPWEAIEAVRQYFARPPKSASLAIEDMRAEKEGEEDVAFAAGTLTP